MESRTYYCNDNEKSRTAYRGEERDELATYLDFMAGIEDEGIVVEADLDEDSEWHQVQFTERSDKEMQSFTRGLTPNQLRNNRGHQPE